MGHYLLHLSYVTKTNSCVHLNAIGELNILVSSWVCETNVVCYIINHTKTRNAKTLQNVKLLDVVVGKNKFYIQSTYFRQAVLNSFSRSCHLFSILTPNKNETETFNLGCDTDLEHSNPTFSLDTSLLMMIYTQIEFGCKRLTGLELIKDIVETVIFWLYKPTLWPWPWR